MYHYISLVQILIVCASIIALCNTSNAAQLYIQSNPYLSVDDQAVGY